MNYSEKVLKFFDFVNKTMKLSAGSYLFDYNMETGDAIRIRQFKIDESFTIQQLIQIRDFLGADELKLNPVNWERGSIDVVPVYHKKVNVEIIDQNGKSFNIIWNKSKNEEKEILFQEFENDIVCFFKTYDFSINSFIVENNQLTIEVINWKNTTIGIDKDFIENLINVTKCTDNLKMQHCLSSSKGFVGKFEIKGNYSKLLNLERF